MAGCALPKMVGITLCCPGVTDLDTHRYIMEMMFEVDQIAKIIYQDSIVTWKSAHTLYLK